jgi:ribosome-associated translation inhibitor RaiA
LSFLCLKKCLRYENYSSIYGVNSSCTARRVFRKKLIKLDTFYDKIHDCQVFLKVENTSAKENKTAEIKLAVPVMIS